MANFIVRVEMHEKQFDYEVLHRDMEILGFSKRILADDGEWYQLPEAEYVGPYPSEDPVDVRDYINTTLSALGWRFEIIVTLLQRAAWTLKRADSSLGNLSRLMVG